ncbi:MAG: type I-E CRISPR-associated protein Cas7/Cse4/CasC [Chloroflexota bacterium]|nr:type I-E CRISPR-associated protein Cas7/Cse4/CasC [Chloroflexota bacterium]
MTTPRFLQIHTLHSYPAALLNRDDSGLAKRLPFGDAVRTRISSQCLKRHWRVADDEFALKNIDGFTGAVRSRNVVDREVIQPLRDADESSDEVLTAVGDAFNESIYGSSGTTESGRQPLLLGLPEVEYLRQQAAAICDAHPDDPKAAAAAAELLFKPLRRNEQRENFRAFQEQTRLPGGLIGALFGRMVTSDPGANIDAAIHVAHAFTVHQEESESDYFSVVDDLQREDEDPGAAHIGDMELTAGLFYGYVVVDVPGLVSNLTGCKAEAWENADRTLAGRVVEHLVQLIATVSPGAKLGSTAPYGYADLMLIEAGSRQPRSLANAFRAPVQARTAAAVTALADHLSKLDAAYGARESRRVMAVDDCNLPQAARLCLDDLAAWVAQTVRNGEAG